MSSVSQSPVQVPKPISASLLSPTTDILMVGGLSIIAMIFYWMFVAPSASVLNVSVVAFNFSFIVNMPHFLASYHLMYSDYRKMILKKPTFFWAAVIAPMLLIGVLIYGIKTSKVEMLALMLQAMYLSVGWHYVKQIYGTAIMTSAIQKRYFGNWEKTFILLNLYSVWAMSWVNSNTSLEPNTVDGISYYGLGLPTELLTVTYYTTAVTFLIAFGIGLRKYILTGSRPATSSLVCFATIYLWYIPSLYHPSFFYFIPFFHSLQYMLFVTALKKNHSVASAGAEPESHRQRLVFLKRFWGFFISIFVLGALSMYFIPKTLDESMPIHDPFLGPTVWVFAFNIFINLHHYFIDNVIWRGDNSYVKEHLVQASQRKAS